MLISPQFIYCVQFWAQCFKEVTEAPPEKCGRRDTGVNLVGITFWPRKDDTEAPFYELAVVFHLSEAISQSSLKPLKCLWWKRFSLDWSLCSSCLGLSGVEQRGCWFVLLLLFLHGAPPGSSRGFIFCWQIKFCLSFVLSWNIIFTLYKHLIWDWPIPV